MQRENNCVGSIIIKQYELQCVLYVASRYNCWWFNLRIIISYRAVDICTIIIRGNRIKGLFILRQCNGPSWNNSSMRFALLCRTKALCHFKNQKSFVSFWSAFSWRSKPVQYLNHIKSQLVFGKWDTSQAPNMLQPISDCQSSGRVQSVALSSLPDPRVTPRRL